MYSYLCETCELWNNGDCQSKYGPDVDPNSGNCWEYLPSLDSSRYWWLRRE